jgi:hypothetical protein
VEDLVHGDEEGVDRANAHELIEIGEHRGD